MNRLGGKRGVLRWIPLPLMVRSFTPQEQENELTNGNSGGHHADPQAQNPQKPTKDSHKHNQVDDQSHLQDQSGMMSDTTSNNSGVSGGEDDEDLVYDEDFDEDDEEDYVPSDHSEEEADAEAEWDLEEIDDDDDNYDDNNSVEALLKQHPTKREHQAFAQQFDDDDAHFWANLEEKQRWLSHFQSANAKWQQRYGCRIDSEVWMENKLLFRREKQRRNWLKFALLVLMVGYGVQLYSTLYCEEDASNHTSKDDQLANPHLWLCGVALLNLSSWTMPVTSLWTSASLSTPSSLARAWSASTLQSKVNETWHSMSEWTKELWQEHAPELPREWLNGPDSSNREQAKVQVPLHHPKEQEPSSPTPTPTPAPSSPTPTLASSTPAPTPAPSTPASALPSASSNRMKEMTKTTTSPITVDTALDASTTTTDPSTQATNETPSSTPPPATTSSPSTMKEPTLSTTSSKTSTTSSTTIQKSPAQGCSDSLFKLIKSKHDDKVKQQAIARCDEAVAQAKPDTREYVDAHVLRGDLHSLLSRFDNANDDYNAATTCRQVLRQFTALSHDIQLKIMANRWLQLFVQKNHNQIRKECEQVVASSTSSSLSHKGSTKALEELASEWLKVFNKQSKVLDVLTKSRAWTLHRLRWTRAPTTTTTTTATMEGSGIEKSSAGNKPVPSIEA